MDVAIEISRVDLATMAYQICLCTSCIVFIDVTLPYTFFSDFELNRLHRGVGEEGEVCVKGACVGGTQLPTPTTAPDPEMGWMDVMP